MLTGDLAAVAFVAYDIDYLAEETFDIEVFTEVTVAVVVTLCFWFL